MRWGTLERVPRRILAPAGHLLRRFSQCRFRLSPGDARGEAPCIRKLKTPPSRREGGRGDRGKQLLLRQANPATGKASPTPGAVSATSTDNQPGKPPLGTYPAGLTSAARVQPRGCKGRSPLHKKTKNPPFPPGRGLGGWGQKSKPKTGLAGDKEGTSPAGQRQGKVSQRGGELFQESPGASLSPPGATAVLPQKRRRRSASDRGSPTAHRSAQCGGKSWR